MVLLEELNRLRALIGKTDGSQAREYLNFSLLSPGFPKGRISEVTGVGKTEFIIKFLKENPELRVAWIEKEVSIYPCACVQKKASLKRILFIEAGSDYVWATLQALRSQLFKVVILSQALCDERTLKQLLIASERSHASLILLSERPTAAWPIALQIQVSKKDDQVSFELLRKRA